MPNTPSQSFRAAQGQLDARALAAMLDTPGGRAITAITPREYCDASTLRVHNIGDPTCAHEWAWGGTRVDDYAWWRCVKCPCEVGCEIPLPF